MPMIDRGQAALVRGLQDSAGRTVTYTRASDGETVSLTAWVGRTLFARTTQEPQAAVVWGERDYLFAAADLVIDDAAFTPAAGDRVTETIDGTACTFEAQTPTAEPVWRYSDQTRQVIRLHTQRV